VTCSAIYRGSVVHTRLRPLRHRLRRRMLCLLLDLDEVPLLARQLRLFSGDRCNLFALRTRDHGDGGGVPLRAQIERQLALAGIPPDGGAIRLLAMPRVLGQVFNPLSVYFCHAADGALRAVLYEVNNTFGERHSYLIPAPTPALTPVAGDGAAAPVVRQSCGKCFYVSPFMDMALTYHFRVALPGTRVAVAIEVRDAAGPVMTACFAGTREALTDANLLRAFLRDPLPAARVLAGIHWEALKLWRRGLKLRPRPAPPAYPVSRILPTAEGR
jgi:DUF1365 family protein